jgi:hypothetical protein
MIFELWTLPAIVFGTGTERVSAVTLDLAQPDTADLTAVPL